MSHWPVYNVLVRMWVIHIKKNAILALIVFQRSQGDASLAVVDVCLQILFYSTVQLVKQQNFGLLIWQRQFCFDDL